MKKEMMKSKKQQKNEQINIVTHAISMNYLHSWYQCSVDETQEPIWTDKHLEELFNDFYLIPKR